MNKPSKNWHTLY